jgi:RNA polymerase II subunit A small phosphatase-like protein
MSKIYEIFIFTASISEYANPVIDRIDPNRLCSVRLYREDCVMYNNIFVKDLSYLNRKISDMIIIDVKFKLI